MADSEFRTTGLLIQAGPGLNGKSRQTQTSRSSNTANPSNRRNARTGRSVLRDPHPPVSQTYLDELVVIARLRAIERSPEPSETLYRRPMVEILRWLFPKRDGFDVLFEELVVGGKPDFKVLKILYRPDGSTDEYTFALVETQAAGRPWGLAEDRCRTYCGHSGNESHQNYGIVQIGLEVRFYLYNQGNFTGLSNKLHLQNDVHEVMQWADHMKANPLPFRQA